MAIASALPLFMLIVTPFSWVWLAACLGVYMVIYIPLSIAACFTFGGGGSDTASITGYRFR